mmetsp:Transcript_12440/g.36985  ORF Transcript_12440/g.36985 Transcript_12440/m.36985 type:complete len:331 (+) Transcript_12440:1126-2118(+)
MDHRKDLLGKFLVVEQRGVLCEGVAVHDVDLGGLVLAQDLDKGLAHLRVQIPLQDVLQNAFAIIACQLLQHGVAAVDAGPSKLPRIHEALLHAGGQGHVRDDVEEAHLQLPPDHRGQAGGAAPGLLLLAVVVLLVHQVVLVLHDALVTVEARRPREAHLLSQVAQVAHKLGLAGVHVVHMQLLGIHGRQVGLAVDVLVEHRTQQRFQQQVNALIDLLLHGQQPPAQLPAGPEDAPDHDREGHDVHRVDEGGQDDPHDRHGHEDHEAPAHAADAERGNRCHRVVEGPIPDTEEVQVRQREQHENSVATDQENHQLRDEALLMQRLHLGWAE